MALSTIDTLLALQGGGSHGALTWGVLERLLQEPRLRIRAISGTSAGAMNAVMLAQGLAEGEAPHASAVLAQYWEAIAHLGSCSPLRRPPAARLSGSWRVDQNPTFQWFDIVSRIWSPYQTNPLGYNPLRGILKERLDFELLNSDAAPRIYLTATNVRTGQARVFTQPEITIDAILASAALPTLFQAVEIDGDPYWDGGYTGNPSLFPLVRDFPGADLILVQANPFERAGTPRTARDVANRMNEITFNSALLKELRVAMHMRDRFGMGSANRLHRVLCDDTLTDFAPSSKLNTEAAYLQHLRERGFQRATHFLDEFGSSIGVAETFDPATLFDQTEPRMQAAE